MSSNQMPGLPGMPSPAVPSSHVQAEQSEAELHVPSHEDLLPEGEKVQTATLTSNDSEVNIVPLAVEKGIPVVAIGKGFYNQMRLKEGDEFRIRGSQDFGDWFRCKNPAHEKARLQYLKDKKAKK